MSRGRLLGSALSCCCALSLAVGCSDGDAPADIGAGGAITSSSGGSAGTAGETAGGAGGATPSSGGSSGNTSGGTPGTHDAGLGATGPGGGDAAGATGGSGGTSGGSGGAGGLDGGGETFTDHCASAEVVSGSLCIENVIGARGDEVDVQVWLLLPEGCTSVSRFSGEFSYDPSWFVVHDKPVDTFLETGLEQCVPTFPKPATYGFEKLGASAESGCPDTYAPGPHLTLRVRISPDTPAGDYELTIVSEKVGDDFSIQQWCRSMIGQPHWHGTIRILE